MSRTPSMDVTEAEVILGVRGNFRITADNRPTVKKWLVAKGLSSAFVGELRYADMELFYNNDEALQRILAAQNKSKTGLVQAVADSGNSHTKSDHTAPSKEPEEAEGNDLSQFALLGKLIQDIAKGSVSAKDVKRIVQDELKNHKSGPTIRIANDNGLVREIEGHAHPNFAELCQLASFRKPDGNHPNIWITGPAGSGKTTAAKMLAKALGLTFHFNGAISQPHEMLGDLARSAYVMAHPAFYRALGYATLSTEFMNASWGGGWSFGSPDLHRSTAMESIRRVIPFGSDCLYIPAVSIHDKSIDDPKVWLTEKLQEHGGVALAA